MILTDTHTHLYLDAFEEDRDAMMQRAFDQGVERIFLPHIDSETTQALQNLVKAYPNNCFPMMGLHPCSVKEAYQKELDHVLSELKTNQYIAVGEIGIDLYWDKTFFKQQVDAFEQQIEWAKEMDLPIVIHARDSFDEIFEVVDRLNDQRLKGIFHCFTGNLEQANHILNYGDFYLGIGGVVTFKNSGLDKVVKELPLDKLVLETDAPYLTPTPHRGKRNEASYTQLVAQKIADLHETGIEHVAEITTNNSKTIFRC
jgi:TatD DNase family protein